MDPDQWYTIRCTPIKVMEVDAIDLGKSPLPGLGLQVIFFSLLKDFNLS